MTIILIKIDNNDAVIIIKIAVTIVGIDNFLYKN